MKALRIEVSFTTREFHSLNLYFNDLSRIGLLTDEEELMLCRRVREGDESALDRLVRGNLRFVVSCAKKYERMGLPLNDLINEGNIGLITAAKKFDDTLGFKFISYAVFWIRQAMMLALGEHSRLIRLPMNQVRNITVAHQLMAELEQKLQRQATVEELAEGVGIPAEKLGRQLSLDKMHLSIYQPKGQETGDKDFSDILSDDNLPPSDHLTDFSDRNTMAERLLSMLSKKERAVLEGLYGIRQDMGCSYDVMADRIKLTPNRVKQIEDVAIKKLRTLVRERGIADA